MQGVAEVLASVPFSFAAQAINDQCLAATWHASSVDG